MRLRDPLVPVFLALAVGVVASRAAAVDVAGIPLAHALTATAVLAALAWIARAFITRRAAWAAGLASVGCLGIALDVVHRPPPPPEIEFTPGESMVLAGCVVEPVAQSPDREQMVLELAEGARARVNWYLEEGQAAPLLRYGQRIEIEAKLRKPRNYANPGAFDFEHAHCWWATPPCLSACGRMTFGEPAPITRWSSQACTSRCSPAGFSSFCVLFRPGWAGLCLPPV